MLTYLYVPNNNCKNVHIRSNKLYLVIFGQRPTKEKVHLDRINVLFVLN